MKEFVRPVLIEARRLIANGWCQGAPAKNTQSGKCFCITGAIQAVTGVSNAAIHCEAWDVLGPAIGGVRPTALALQIWNDEPGRTQQEVVAAFDRAIEATA